MRSGTYELPLAELVNDFPWANQAEVPPSDLLSAGGETPHRLNLLSEERVLLLECLDVLLQVCFHSYLAIELEKTSISHQGEKKQKGEEAESHDESTAWS